MHLWHVQRRIHMGTIPYFRGSIVSEMSDKMLGKLQNASACVRFLRLPEGSFETSVSLAWIGSCEVRIFEGPRVTSDGMPVFWLELFDHSAKMSVDSFSCREIEDAVVILEDFFAQADQLKDASGPGDAGTQC